MNPASEQSGKPPFESTPARLLATARRLGERPAFFVRGESAWEPTSWSTYAADVQRAARALVALGLRPGEAVCILGFSRPEWVTMDLAAMMAGGMAAGIYWTNSPAEVEYIANHSRCRVLLAEDESQLAKIVARREAMPHLETVVLMRGTAANAPWQLAWNAFLELGDESHQPEVERRLAAIAPDDIGTLIYTSGTTGPSKAVILSHHNLSWMAALVPQVVRTDENDRLMCYLPLAHISEKMNSVCGHVFSGYALYFARSIETLGDHLKEVRPTVFFAVPRVWEKMHAGIEAKLATATGVKARLAHWALDVGRRWHVAQSEGRAPGIGLHLQRALAARLVHRKVQQAIGLDQARMLVSGAAPISTEKLQFFTGLGLPIFEVYGLSECSGPTSLCVPGAIRLGSVGRALPGTALRIADDGEILIGGPHVFLGYKDQPDETAKALAGGWLMSGDLGHIDQDGYLFVTGRKKDLLITSGGKNISPSNIEAALMNHPLIEHAVVCGDGRHFLAALVTLRPDGLAAFARTRGLTAEGAHGLHHHPDVLAEIQHGIDAVNQDQARVASVRKFKVIERPLTIETGELTPTMKVKRKAVLQRYSALVDEMYRS